MAWPETLTVIDQALIQNWIDQEFRPATLLLVKALANAYAGTIPSFIASQSGLTSSYASPAADSIAGLLATLPGADVIPLATGQNQTGLALAQPLTVSEVITYMGGINSIVVANYVSAALQAWSNVIGAPNL
jgi:hypothetical protein